MKIYEEVNEKLHERIRDLQTEIWEAKEMLGGKHSSQLDRDSRIGDMIFAKGCGANWQEIGYRNQVDMKMEAVAKLNEVRADNRLYAIAVMELGEILDELRYGTPRS